MPFQGFPPPVIPIIGGFFMKLMTEELEKVNTDKQPVELEGSVSVSQDGHFSGTIDNWEIVSGGDVEAE